MAEERQRVDKWLWHARVVKTRAAAQMLVTSGKVRLNRVRIDQAAKGVKPGDVLTIQLSHRVAVLEVVAFADRRGSPADAALTFRDLAPAPAPDDDAQ